MADKPKRDRAEYMRRYRAKQGAKTGQMGPPPSSPCGTLAAYKRHLRKKEKPCPACAAARLDWERGYHARRRNRT